MCVGPQSLCCPRCRDTAWKLSPPPDIASAPGAHGGRTGGIAVSLARGVRRGRIPGDVSFCRGGARDNRVRHRTTYDSSVGFAKTRRVTKPRSAQENPKCATEVRNFALPEGRRNSEVRTYMQCGGAELTSVQVSNRAIARLADPLCSAGVFLVAFQVICSGRASSGKPFAVASRQSCGINRYTRKRPKPCRLLYSNKGSIKEVTIVTGYALLWQDSKLQVSGLMMKGYNSFLTKAPTPSSCSVYPTEEQVVAFLTKLKARHLRLD